MKICGSFIAFSSNLTSCSRVACLKTQSILMRRTLQAGMVSPTPRKCIRWKPYECSWNQSQLNEIAPTMMAGHRILRMSISARSLGFPRRTIFLQSLSNATTNDLLIRVPWSNTPRGSQCGYDWQLLLHSGVEAQLGSSSLPPAHRVGRRRQVPCPIVLFSSTE